MIRLRTATAAVFALSLAGLLAPAPALAADTTAGPQASQSQQALTPAELQVDHFFSAYRDDILNGDPAGAYDVRRQYLTDYLNGQLDQWAADNNADPVFRAQNTPVGWSVAQGDSGAGHTTVYLTEDWGDGSTTQVNYQLRLADLVIDDLRNG
ncbi:hypothetical protein [Kitasatospora viridis]|uniref:Uncharacterized protein n=1 Tax=Kitasatospora viridis TaxID=281105 RepID=A0A561UN39_9ACTN|nr:hypothetical protein [Kitasatospora viridis]TWG00744.1 hypothetical protein FHX73_114624 [Kitasatospora viridis]